MVSTFTPSFHDDPFPRSGHLSLKENAQEHKLSHSALQPACVWWCVWVCSRCGDYVEDWRWHTRMGGSRYVDWNVL